MSVLRIRRSGFVVCLSFLLAACSGSSSENTGDPGGATYDPISLSGSVGDGPVVDAEIRVTDAHGQLLEQHSSDAFANYELSLPADAALPVLVTASGGTDLVTGRALDFTLVGAALQTSARTVNLSPLSTLAVRGAQCGVDGLTVENLQQAWQRVREELSMGLDPALVADPMSEPVTSANVESVVLANEALGEVVRRTVRALSNAGSPSGGDDIIEQIACDLVGRQATAGGAPVDARVIMAFKGQELVVRLETLAGRLEVDGSSAVSRMNESIRTIMPEFADPSVAQVPVSAAARNEAMALLSLFQAAAASDALARVAVELGSADLGAVPAQIDAALTPVLHTDVNALADNLAFADDSILTALAERRARRKTASRPVLSLAAEPAHVGAGEITTLSWATSDADRCVASGGWNGGVELQGTARSEPLTLATRFELACVGLGGTARRATTVTVEGAPEAQPDPQPEPSPDPEPNPQPEPVPEPQLEPTVNLQAANSIIDSGGSAQLSWSSTGANSCSASGGWSGSRPVSGNASVGPLNAQTTFSMNCSGDGGNAMAMISVSINGQVELEWQAPTENTDGSVLTDLDGYRIHFGQTSRSYTDALEIPAGGTKYSLSLPSGFYYFAMTAVDAAGNESAYSNEVVKTVD